MRPIISPKRVFFPFPTSEMMANEKKALTDESTCMGKAAQGRSGSVFFNQIQLIWRAQPKCSVHSKLIHK
jgi:hypothetical protein